MISLVPNGFISFSVSPYKLVQTGIKLIMTKSFPNTILVPPQQKNTPPSNLLEPDEESPHKCPKVEVVVFTSIFYFSSLVRNTKILQMKPFSLSIINIPQLIITRLVEAASTPDHMTENFGDAPIFMEHGSDPAVALKLMCCLMIDLDCAIDSTTLGDLIEVPDIYTKISPLPLRGLSNNQQEEDGSSAKNQHNLWLQQFW